MMEIKSVLFLGRREPQLDLFRKGRPSLFTRLFEFLWVNRRRSRDCISIDDRLKYLRNSRPVPFTTPPSL